MSRAVMTAGGYVAIVSDAASLSSAPGATASSVILPLNESRLYVSVFNDSSAVLYLAWGPVCSPSAYTTKVPPAGLYELPQVQGRVFVGPISACWATGTGNARVTEAT